MQIGSWGDITFEVSSESVRTFETLMQQTAGRWSVHQPINSRPRPQFLGQDQGQIEFAINLFTDLGIDVREEKERIERFVREGTIAPLMLGMRPVSEGDWYAESAETTAVWVDNRGNITYAKITMVMREYF